MNFTINDIIGVGEGLAVFGLTFTFPLFDSHLCMTYGQLGDILTLSIQGLSLLYIYMKIKQIKNRKKD